MADEFQIFFIKPPRDEENSSTLTKAFETVQSSTPNFKPVWLSQEDCLKLGKGKGVYICEPFSGPAFDYLKQLESRIYGPLCILSCLLHEMELPKKGRKPIYNLAMRRVKICCTSVDKTVRDDIQSKVILMSGEVETSLTKDVTHLIAGEVGSNKYNVAIDNDMLVMTSEWVLKVWEASKKGHVAAGDECFTKYRCPPFLGLTLVVSGYNSAERNTLKNFILRGGGCYSGEMKMGECTHLITKKPEGAKYEAAKSWKIRIVEDKWLTECMDKMRYMDPTPYLVGGNNVKTSTPERRSVAGPHINDVSSIMGDVGNTSTNSTFAQIDETTDLSITRHGNQSTRIVGETMSATRLEDSSMASDVGAGQADLFLDDCKIYFSGVRPALEEKLKKIVMSGGGLRALELTESVTHMVMADVIPKDMNFLRKMEEIPSVVSTDWLMDCFRQRMRLEEKPYLREDLGGHKSTKGRLEVPNLPGPAPSRDQDETLRPGGHNQTGDSTQDTQKEAPSDMEMVDLLSQYMEGDQHKPADTTSGNHDDPPDDGEKEGRPDDPAGEPTLDPQVSVLDNQDEMFFTGKSFIVLGFDEEETEQLAELILEKGGKLMPRDKKRRVIDLAIVPLLGHPVDVTVGEVLTNGWMQMCIETDCLLGYDEHWMSRPLEIPTNSPLADCCISVSGHIGVERECIVHLAQSLGAVCQDHLARKPTREMKANTHLIVSDSQGSKKYNAARKWKMPTVGKEWLLACLAAGKHVGEADYDIIIVEQKQREALQETTDATLDPDVSDRSDDVSRQSKPQTDAEVSLDLPELETKQPPKSPSFASPRVPSSSSESTADKLLDNPMAQAKVASITSVTPDPSSGLNRSRTSTPRSACRPNQTENISAAKTPLAMTPINNLRRQVLTPAQGSAEIPPGTPRGLIKGGGATPRTFLHPDYKPKWNFAGCFDTPDPEPVVDLNKSTPLMEAFSRGIKKFVENTSKKPEDDTDMQCSQGIADHPPALHGVVISVAKKLGKSHEEYNTLVVELGGDFSWHMGAHVTHFVFQGRPDKELKKAKEDGKLVVSPYWLYACKEQDCRVDENHYPHNFNPNQCLNMTPSRAGGATPRSTRARAAARPDSDKPASPAPQAAAPSPVPQPRKAPVLNLAADLTPGRSRAVRKDTVLSAKKPAEKPSPTGRASPLPSRRAGIRKKSAEESNLDKEEASEDETLPPPPLPVAARQNNIVDETSNTTDNNASTTQCETSDSDHSKNKEAKKLLTETLGNVLADASRSHRTTRRKGRLNLSGQLSASENNLSGNSPWTTKDKRSADTSLADPPQSVQVNWDDPTARLEEERLAHRLAHVCDPSQQTQNNTEDMMMAAMDMPDMTKSRHSMRSPTPEPPSLAFPRPTSRVMTPQPVELLSEEDSSDTTCDMRSPPVVLMSGISNEEKMDYAALIEQLGGKTLEKQNFDPACSHLICAIPARNEKFLACIASGKWVLHKSYLEACRKEGKFVNEEIHEWGSSFTLPLMQNMTASANKLALAAHKWRRKVEHMKKSNPDVTGAFDDWKVLLCLPSAKEENFSRLLAAGGASVTSVRPPFGNDIVGTHAFIDLNKVKIPQDQLIKLISIGVHCLKPEFIPAYLTDEPTPDPADFYPADVVALRADMPETSKRKRTLSSNEQQSASKIQRR